MFKKILVALDHSQADAVLLPRVKELARLTKAAILLVHISTGWVARWQENLNLSDSGEIKEDRVYLEKVQTGLHDEGFRVNIRHATGEPAEQILKAAREESCDLIAMATHGHRLISDLIYGTTITHVRHESEIPIFLVRARSEQKNS